MNSPEANENLLETSRFVLQRRLGAGGFGVVYQAWDNERQAVVALKLLHNQDAAALYNFKQEFRSLTNITHPNLVTLYELLSARDQWFFTMELVKGVNFLDYIWEGAELAPNSVDTDPNPVNTQRITLDSHPTIENTDAEHQRLGGSLRAMPKVTPNIDRLKTVLKQLIEGVNTLHIAGKLHCDLKPSNVLVTPTGRVVILDFGLVTETAKELEDLDSHITGTPDYMSPEHGAGMKLSEASDWYSMGVMIYEALTGQLPFDPSFGSVLIQKVQETAPPPRDFVKDIPTELNQLCIDLLQLNPHKRPNGQQILERLGGKRITKEMRVRNLLQPEMPLVGRETQLAALNEGFQAMKRGKAALLYVRGLSGIGKSTLIERFLTERKIAEPQTIVLRGRCYEHESVPYKAFDNIIDELSQYLKRLNKERRKRLLPVDILTVAKLFPVLRQVEGIDETGQALEIPDSQELRRRAFSVLRDMLRRIAQQNPLILYIDDLQWGDLDSAALLREIMRVPNPPHLMLMATYRAEDMETSPILKSLLAAEEFNNIYLHTHTVQVDKLSMEQAQQLITKLLGADRQISPAQAQLIAQESAGNPFFIDELVRYSQMDDNSIELEKISLEEAICTRVAQLPEAAQRLLELMAVAGQPLARTTAKLAAALEAEEQTALAFLRARNMVRLSGAGTQERIEIYHDRIRETIMAKLTPAKRKQYHQQLANTLESTGHEDYEALTMHFAGAEQPQKASHYAVKAANKATAALAFNHAAKLYRLALSFKGEDTNIADLLLKLAQALVFAGRGAEAAQVFLEIVKLVNAKEGLRLKQRAFEQYLFSGCIDEGLKVLREVASALGMRVAQSARQALIPLLFKRAQLRLRGLSFKERTEAAVPAEELFIIDTCWAAGLGLTIVDTVRGADFQVRNLLLALKAGEPYRILRALSLEAAIYSTHGSRSEPRTSILLATAEHLLNKLGESHSRYYQAQGLLRLMEGLTHFLSGRWRISYQLFTQSNEILRNRCTGVAWERDSAQIFALRALLYLGELNQLTEQLPTIFEEAKERGDIYGITGIGTAVAYIPHLVADDVESARREVREAIKQWAQEGFYLQNYWALLAEVQIEIYAGEGTKAFQLITSQWPELQRGLLLEVQNSVVEMVQLRARSALAKSLTSPDKHQLLRAVEKDAKILLRQKVPNSQAMAELLLAAVAAGRKDRATTIKYLTSAAQGFQQTEMALYRAATQLRLGQVTKDQSLLEQASTWLTQQQIKNPTSMANMLAPGDWQN